MPDAAGLVADGGEAGDGSGSGDAGPVVLVAVHVVNAPQANKASTMVAKRRWIMMVNIGWSGIRTG